MFFLVISVGKYLCEGFDFFLLMVDVEECLYVVGKIFGLFFCCEGCFLIEVIFVCCLIDCLLCLLFVDGFCNEVQIVIIVFLIVLGEFYDVFVINVVLVLMQIFGLLFLGFVVGVCFVFILGYGQYEDQWVVFLIVEQVFEVVFDLIVVGCVVIKVDGLEDVVIMMVEVEVIEGSWNLIKVGVMKLSEEIVVQGFEVLKLFIVQFVKVQVEFVLIVLKELGVYLVFFVYSDEVYDFVFECVFVEFSDVYQIVDKIECQMVDDVIKDCVKVELIEVIEVGLFLVVVLFEFFVVYKFVMKKIVCGCIFIEGVCIDGCGLVDICLFDVEVQVILCVYGFVIFQCGEIQILGIIMLNMFKMEQQIDLLLFMMSKCYMYYYNFLFYLIGEIGCVGLLKCCEIGYGFFVECVFVLVLLSCEEFFYVICQVFEVFSFNGFMLMGFVCVLMLLLLNVGVLLCVFVVGIVMGFVFDEVDGEICYVVLIDILGVEDVFGDMDFKVVGISEFVIVIQFDMKFDGILLLVFVGVLIQVKEVCLMIFNVLNVVIDVLDEMVLIVLCVISVQILVDKIGELIGLKGKMINVIQDEIGVQIFIEEDGIVYIGVIDGFLVEVVCVQVNVIVNFINLEVGEQFFGIVVKIVIFGVFVLFLLGKDGLFYVIEVCKFVGGKCVENVDDVFLVGQKIFVKIMKIDDCGKLLFEFVFDDVFVVDVVLVEDVVVE